MEGKVSFYVRPRGNCVAVIAGPGLKRGVAGGRSAEEKENCPEAAVFLPLPLTKVHCSLAADGRGWPLVTGLRSPGY